MQRIIISKFRGTDSYLSLTTSNWQKRIFLSVITGLAHLTDEGITAYLNTKKTPKNKAIKKGYKATCFYHDLIKNSLYIANKELNIYGTYQGNTLKY